MYSLVEARGATFVRLPLVPSQHDHYAETLRRAKWCVTGLAILTAGHMWLEPVVLSEKLEVLWKEPKRLALIKEKEIDPTGPKELMAADIAHSTQLAGWISAQYPQVSAFHNAGLFLLRSSFAYDFADYYHAEAVVGFYRMVEAVTARRARVRRVELKHVLSEASALKMIQRESGVGFGWTEEEITDMYILRSGPSAHGAQLAVVSRAEAAEVKLFAESFVAMDYLARRGGAIDVGGPIQVWRGRVGRARAQASKTP